MQEAAVYGGDICAHVSRPKVFDKFGFNLIIREKKVKFSLCFF
jgi:hypothetical protein